MATNSNLVLQLLITAKDQASGILSNIKTQLAGLATAIGAAFTIKEAAVFEKALDAVRARADETGPALDALNTPLPYTMAVLSRSWPCKTVPAP